ncbi:MAG: FimB/Mfa2 family fimbrial subunit [Parabacteroides merdae]
MKSILTKKVLHFWHLSQLRSLPPAVSMEDLDECYKLTLKVVNHKGDDITALSVVSEAKLFIYDNNSKLLDTRDLNDAFIRGKETIELNYPESSKLHLIAWGNLKGHQDVNEATKAEDFAVSLKSEGEIAQSPDSIFFGDIDVTVRGTVWLAETRKSCSNPKPERSR